MARVTTRRRRFEARIVVSMLFITQFVCALCFGAPASAAADESAAPTAAPVAVSADTAERAAPGDRGDRDGGASHTCQAGSGAGVDNRAPAASAIALLGFATVFTVLVWAVGRHAPPRLRPRPPGPARAWTRLRTALCVQRV